MPFNHPTLETHIKREGNMGAALLALWCSVPRFPRRVVFADVTFPPSFLCTHRSIHPSIRIVDFSKLRMIFRFQVEPNKRKPSPRSGCPNSTYGCLLVDV